MFRVVMAAGAIALAMVAVHHGDVLGLEASRGRLQFDRDAVRRGGHVAGVSPRQASRVAGWSRRSCNRRGLVAEVELWRCVRPRWPRPARTHAAAHTVKAGPWSAGPVPVP